MDEVDAASGYRERPSRFGGAVLWTRTVDGSDGGFPVLPDGCMDLIWMGGRLVVAGPDTRAHHPPAANGARYVGVRFYPGTAPALLGLPADEMRDQRVDLAQLWSASVVRRFVEQLEDAVDRAAALDEVVMWRAAEAEPVDPLVRRVVVALDNGWSVASIAAASGVGERTLRRRCSAAFGYGPKTLARVLRLQRALAAARGGMPLAETAALAGFADQPHLSREVRTLTGMSLGELLAGA
ncbi:helix-turn-helix transcriptional regulator [Nocardia sp. NPDC049220]|uniref:helix-turn-helix transcriptional regulator n=1 Tax=Nocardia sp. NPDC049220 TaxID=3155273 RepID=UPI0033F50928